MNSGAADPSRTPSSPTTISLIWIRTTSFPRYSMVLWTRCATSWLSSILWVTHSSPSLRSSSSILSSLYCHRARHLFHAQFSFFPSPLFFLLFSFVFFWYRNKNGKRRPTDRARASWSCKPATRIFAESSSKTIYSRE